MARRAQIPIGMVSPSTSEHISRIERGVTACSIDLLPVLSVTLQVSTDYLLMGKSIDKEMTRTQLLSVISQLTLITQGL